MGERTGKSPLRPLQMSPDSCALEIFFVRFPYGESEANGPLWNEVDEQQLPAELRQRLALNGFRTGLVGGQVPVPLAKLLGLKGRTAPTAPPNGTKVADLECDPQVVRSHRQVRAGRRTEIVCSDVYDELPVLISEPRGTYGESLSKAQGIFGVQATPETDGRVRLKLTPEIQHGENKSRWVRSEGALRIEPGKTKRVFDEMTFETVLSPGQMLVLSTMTNRPGSLGHKFFTRSSTGKTEQTLMVIRLAQTQHDDLFNPDEALPLDMLAEVAEAK